MVCTEPVHTGMFYLVYYEVRDLLPVQDLSKISVYISFVLVSLRVMLNKLRICLLFLFYFSNILQPKELYPENYSTYMQPCLHIGGSRGRVVKVADFSALNHSIISPLWVRASLGARATCGTSQVLLAGVSGGFSPRVLRFSPHLPIDSSRYE